jgi:hypothetical protein
VIVQAATVIAMSAVPSCFAYFPIDAVMTARLAGWRFTIRSW